MPLRARLAVTVVQDNHLVTIPRTTKEVEITRKLVCALVKHGPEVEKDEWIRSGHKTVSTNVCSEAAPHQQTSVSGLSTHTDLS